MTSTRPAADAVDILPANAQVDALVQLSFRVHQILGKIGAEQDLSVVQIRMLGVLRDREPSMLALAGHLGLDKSSTTGLVSRAEKRGLVQRARDPHDRRSVTVSLTAHGRALVNACARDVEREINGLVAPLPDHARRQLVRHISEILAPPGDG
ncbi:MarR family winged helix-turn-helix transcriptional regulator [Streptomyces hoynatensis]|uniref:MarR family transcriptional regulator n=1 Tax=Streptomyces hoynatensis TaxID=1141874 RepID=A0A3A9Z6R8_9ACTN|nr:MarR family winged helix-turn-helix transcriptional regulator [Streptomyces hoynatensis]RKN43963.1 MarR family transcriptional regulator [Streptomyces hoynatensis]